MEWLLVILLAWQDSTPSVVLQIPVETEELCEQAREKAAWSLAMLGEPVTSTPETNQGEQSNSLPKGVRQLRPGEIVLPIGTVPAKVAATCLNVRSHAK